MPWLAGLLLALLLAQAIAGRLAIGLRLRLPWRVQAFGVAAPLAILLPLLAGGRLLVPSDATMALQLPDAPAVAHPDDAYGVFNDAILQLLPWEAEVRRSLAAGYLPLWSDVLDGGSSPWVNPQASVLSPIALLARLLPIEHFLLGALAIKMLLAFEGCWLLARAVGGRRFGAALAAAGFAFGGPLTAWSVFPLSSAVAWSPWLVLAAMRTMRRPEGRRIAVLALVGAALLLAGHPEIALAEGLLAAGFVAVAWPRSARSARPAGSQPVRHRAAGGGLISLGARSTGSPRSMLPPPLAPLPPSMSSAASWEIGGCQLGGPGGWREARRLGALAAAAGLAVSLAASSLLPFALVARQSLRGSRAGDAMDGRPSPAPVNRQPAGSDAIAAPGVLGRSPADRPSASLKTNAVVEVGSFDRHLLAPGDQRLLLGILNPWAFGRPFHETYSGPHNWPIAAGGYVGVVALGGAVAALASRRRRWVAGLAALAAGSWLVTAGFWLSRWLLAHVPLGSALAVDRFLPVAALPLALMAADGWRVLLRRRQRTGGSAEAIAARLLVGAVAAASLAVRHDGFLIALWVLAVGGACLGSGFEPAVGAGRPAKAWPARFLPAAGAGLITLAAVLDLGTWDHDVIPRGHRELFYPRTAVIRTVEGLVAAPGGPWRAVGGGFALYPSLLPFYGVADIRIDNPLGLAQQLRPLGEVFEFRPEGRRYKSAFRHLDHPLLDFLAVRAVVTPAGLAVPPRFAARSAAGPLQVWENPAALPRLFVPTGAVVCPRSELAETLLALRDPRRVVLAAEEVGDWRPPEVVGEPSRITIADSRPGRLVATVPMEHRAESATNHGRPVATLLATSLPFPAGWSVRGPSGPLRRVTINGAWLGVVVPPGGGRVELNFVPPGFAAGLVASVLGVLGVVLAASVVQSRRS